MGSFVRFVAILTSGIVLLGFAFFAVDEMDRGSKTSRICWTGSQGLPVRPRAHCADPGPGGRAREANGTVHEPVDDANDILLDPFTGIVDSNDRWVNHGVPTLLALLLYGLGLGMLANMLPKERETHGDWRTA